MRSRPMLSLILAAPFLLGCHHTVPAATAATAANAASAAPTGDSGIDPSIIDRSVKPCDDFYQYACGGWIAKTQIPADRPAWFRSFSEIHERNETKLRQILDNAAAGKGTDPYSDKIGNFYAACMDEAKIEATAPAELHQLLAQVDRIKTIPELATELAQIHLTVSNAMFRFDSEQDFKDANLVIGGLDQSGLGLPDRDYYLKDDARMKQTRAAYLEHVQKMFELAGSTPKQAATQAKTVMRVEHTLAEASMPRVERRNPKNLYHRLDLAGIEKLAPRFPWALYLKAIGHPEVTQINVAVPGFFAALNTQLQKTSLSDWRTYLRWHVIHGAAPTLSKAFVDENFRFYGKTMLGTQELQPRWKRCVQATDRDIGEALAIPFVRETFGASGKTASEEMVLSIEQVMHQNLSKLSWMDEPTRRAAIDKLTHIANKIGYPDKWRNYDKLKVTRDSYLQNDLNASAFESQRELDKIGKPLDRTEWGMTPPTVNAYYNPSLNEMVFPAGILQSPFFSRMAWPSVNYGGIGMVMGHELTHGFDDEGRQFDAQGDLRDWWTPSVSKEFDRRAECVVKQFDDYVSVDSLHVNGKLTLGENIADLGGIKLAYAAFHATHPGSGATKNGEFTEDQLFFLGTAQSWCGKRKPEYSRMRVLTDPHSPPHFRVDGPMSNMPEFAHAWSCAPGSKMVRQNQCSIW